MQQPKEMGYTYADYLTWEGDERYELIDGVPYMMAPAPTPRHQEIGVGLTSQLWAYLKGKTCKVYPAPFDVRLAADANDDTVVQPDISVICDPSKIDARGCKGAPDMVVEILSPSTIRHDGIIKLNKYREAGIREYWIVDPERSEVRVHLLQNGEYFVRAYDAKAEVPVSILEDCTIDLTAVFPQAEEEPEVDGPAPDAL